MYSLSKEQSVLSKETIQNAFFQNYAPFSTLTFCNISVITEDIYLKLEVCSLSNERSIQSRETFQKAFFSESCPFF